MLGRGQRARGIYSGIVFIKFQVNMEKAIEKMIKAETKFEFKDGAKNLKLMSKMKDEIESKKIKGLPIWVLFARTYGKLWINFREDFLTIGKADGIVKTTINNLYDKLEDNTESEDSEDSDSSMNQ